MNGQEGLIEHGDYITPDPEAGEILLRVLSSTDRLNYYALREDSFNFHQTLKTCSIDDLISQEDNRQTLSPEAWLMLLKEFKLSRPQLRSVAGFLVGFLRERNISLTDYEAVITEALIKTFADDSVDNLVDSFNNDQSILVQKAIVFVLGRRTDEASLLALAKINQELIADTWLRLSVLEAVIDRREDLVLDFYVQGLLNYHLNTETLNQLADLPIDFTWRALRKLFSDASMVLADKELILPILSFVEKLPFDKEFDNLLLSAYNYACGFEVAADSSSDLLDKKQALLQVAGSIKRTIKKRLSLRDCEQLALWLKFDHDEIMAEWLTKAIKNILQAKHIKETENDFEKIFSVCGYKAKNLSVGAIANLADAYKTDKSFNHAYFDILIAVINAEAEVDYENRVKAVVEGLERKSEGTKDFVTAMVQRVIIHIEHNRTVFEQDTIWQAFYKLRHYLSRDLLITAIKPYLNHKSKHVRKYLAEYVEKILLPRPIKNLGYKDF